MVSKAFVLAAVAAQIAGVAALPQAITTGTVNPATTTSRCPRLCADWVDACGRLYGTCVSTWCAGVPWPQRPTPPPCSKTTTGITTPFITTTTTSSTTSSGRTTIAHTTSCSRVCFDYNSCGMPVGTCFPSCSGQTWPRVPTPTCTSTSRSTTVTREFPTTTLIPGPGPTLGPWAQCGPNMPGVLCQSGYKCHEWVCINPLQRPIFLKHSLLSLIG